MSAQPSPVVPAPSAERARAMLDRDRAERLITREQRRFARQLHAHTAQLARSARPRSGAPR